MPVDAEVLGAEPGQVEQVADQPVQSARLGRARSRPTGRTSAPVVTPSASDSANPVIAVSGVRSSWDTESRNSRCRPSLVASAADSRVDRVGHLGYLGRALRRQPDVRGGRGPGRGRLPRPGAAVGPAGGPAACRRPRRPRGRPAARARSGRLPAGRSWRRTARWASTMPPPVVGRASTSGRVPPTSRVSDSDRPPTTAARSAPVSARAARPVGRAAGGPRRPRVMNAKSIPSAVQLAAGDAAGSPPGLPEAPVRVAASAAASASVGQPCGGRPRRRPVRTRPSETRPATSTATAATAVVTRAIRAASVPRGRLPAAEQPVGRPRPGRGGGHGVSTE